MLVLAALCFAGLLGQRIDIRLGFRGHEGTLRLACAVKPISQPRDIEQTRYASLLDRVRTGDKIRFQVEENGGSHVITGMEPDF